MDFKVKISCHKCKCSFELRPEVSNCSKIICPNCSSKVPDEYASHIINGIRELGSVPETYTSDENPFLSQNGFTFKVQGFSVFDLDK